MKTYLQLNSSLHGAGSQSSRLARQFIETLVRTDRSADRAAASARVVATHGSNR
jgi:FMN-dependent NADH-azoreductase